MLLDIENNKTTGPFKTALLKRVHNTFTTSVFLISPIVARFYANTHTNTFPVHTDALLPWFRGVSSDAAVGLLLGAIVCLLPIKRTARLALWALWAIALSLNTAHILVNHSHADIRFASLALHGDFIFGSVLALSNLVIIIIIASITLALGFLLQRFAIPGVRTFVLLVASLAAVSVTVAIPIDLNSPDWLQMSALESNFQSLSGETTHVLKQDFPEHIRKRFLYSDLSNNTFINYPDKPQNVLLILMEGVSYKAMNSGNMPYLKKLARKNITYTNFISLQRQTNRGLFAILCGDYPNFLTQESKSDYYGSFGAPRACLPEILSDNSYTNTFLQGSNLGYMGKDHFTAAIGFHEAIGNISFKKPLGRTEWGVDDLTLLRGALDKTRDLSGRGSPWFLTVLTSGSHHPYNVPGVLLPDTSDILSYLDNALKEMVEGLRADGILNNTLVLITSDESGMLADSPIGQNHVPMVAIIPGYDKPFHHPGFLSHMDIQLSILDYLGIPVRDSMGRSIFRYYSSGREIIFGNIDKKHVYLINTTTKSLLTCTTVYFRCTNSDISTTDPSLVRDIRTFLQYNDLDSRNLPDGTLFHLVNTTYTGYREIMGDRKVVLNKGDTITFKLEILPEGLLEVLVQLDGSKSLIDKRFYSFKGKPVKVDFTYTSAWNNFNVYNNLYVTTDPQISYTIKELLITKKKAL